MAKNVNHVSLIKSTNTAMTSGDSVFIASGQTGPKLPTPDVLIQGEIAVNLAKGVETLSIKNTDNEIVTFSSDKIIKKVIVDNERITAAALNDLEVNKQDVLTPGSGISIVNNVISSTVESITVDDALSSTSENPVQNKVVNNALSSKVNSATYIAYTANTASILSGKQDTMSAGTNISIDDNVISTTFDIDTELSSSSTNPVANSAITKVIEENELITAAALNDLEERKLDASAYTPTDLSDLYALSAVVSANSVVTAAALNDLNTRLLPTITGVSFNEQLAYVDGGVAYLDDISAHTHAISEVDGLQASLDSKVSGITVNNANKVTPTNGVANLTINANTVGALPTGTTLDGIPDGTNRKLTDYATTIEYYSSGSTHEIRLKNGSTTLATVNANDFIKDGMVDGVTVDEPTSGQNSGVTCLIVTFNTDAGKEDIEIPLYQIFDSSLYYTKVEIDNKLGSGFTGENSGNTVTKVIEDNELAISAALNDLNDRKLDASAYTPTDLSGYYTKQEINEDKLGSGFTGDNSGVTVTQAINETEEVVAAALNDLNDRIESLDGDIETLESAIQNIDIPTIDGDSDLWSSGSTGVPATSALSEVLEEFEEVASTAINNLNDRVSELEVTPDYYVAAGSYDNANGVLTLQHAVHVSGQTYSDNLVGPTVTISGLPVNAGSGMFAPADYNTLTPAIAGTVYGSCSTASATSAKTASASGFRMNTGSLACIYFSNDVTGPSLLNINNTGAKNIYYRGAALTANSDLIKAGDRVLFSYNGQYNIIAIDRAAVSGTTGGGGTDANAITGVSFNGTDATVINRKAIISGDTAQKVLLEVVDDGNGNLSFKYYGESTTLSPAEVKAIFDDETKDVVLTGDYLGQNVCYHLSSIEIGAAYEIYTFSNTVEWVRFTDSEKFYRLMKVAVDFREVDGNLVIHGAIQEIDLTPSTSFTAHTADTSVHVTSAEKSTWNGKQDALSNASVLTGITSQKVTNWDSAATNNHTHSNKTVLDGITSAKVTQWNNAISGVSFNGTTATVNNHVAAITATIPAAPGTLTTTATTAQATATNEALSGNIALHKVSKTGNYNDLLNKPTIPAAANNATITLQFGNSSSAFTVNASSNLTINLATLIGIPAPTASDNGKILGVVNGQFAWITPTTIYTGTGTPNQNTGNNGDIYLQTS